MKKKAQLTAILFALLLGTQALFAWTAPQETLTYDVMYKWGLINKKAGSVSLTTVNLPGKPHFSSELTGATAPWADKFFEVRDTLRGTIHKSTFFPLHYEKISHEGGSYDRNILSYTREGNTVTANAKVWRRKKKETDVTYTEKVHSASGPTVDMLSSYYYMRQLDYSKMAEGEARKLNVFSGKRKEVLTIRYKGKENVKVGKHTYPAYHIVFTFTSKNGKKTSDDMEAWISTGDERIPLLLEGSLAVGKVRCIYSGQFPNLKGEFAGR